MKTPTETRADNGSGVPLAIVLEGVSETWQMNVVQALGSPAIATVEVDGYGTIAATAFRLSPEQARHLATQITELLGPESENHVHVFAGPHLPKQL